MQGKEKEKSAKPRPGRKKKEWRRKKSSQFPAAFRQKPEVKKAERDLGLA